MEYSEIEILKQAFCNLRKEAETALPEESVWMVEPISEKLDARLARLVNGRGQRWVSFWSSASNRVACFIGAFLLIGSLFWSIIHISGVFNYPDIERQKELLLGRYALTLQYNKTTKHNAAYKDIYLDENGDEYAFDKKGELICYTPKLDAYSGDAKLIKTQVRAIAEKELQRLFPNQMKCFELISCEREDQWKLYYAEFIGKEGFIEREGIGVEIRLDGDIKYCQYDRRPELQLFDLTRLNRYNKAYMESWALDCGRAKKGQETILKEARYYLQKIDKQYFIVVAGIYQTGEEVWNEEFKCLID